MQPAARDALLFQEPACPICFEPFSTEAPDDPEDEDHRPALICGRPSVCACCYVSQVCMTLAAAECSQAGLYMPTVLSADCYGK